MAACFGHVRVSSVAFSGKYLVQKHDGPLGIGYKGPRRPHRLRGGWLARALTWIAIYSASSGKIGSDFLVAYRTPVRSSNASKPKWELSKILGPKKDSKLVGLTPQNGPPICRNSKIEPHTCIELDRRRL